MMGEKGRGEMNAVCVWECVCVCGRGVVPDANRVKKKRMSSV